MKNRKLILLIWLIFGCGFSKVGFAQKGRFMFEVEQTNKTTLFRGPSTYVIDEDDLYEVPYYTSNEEQIYIKEKNNWLILHQTSKDHAFHSPIIIGVKVNNSKNDVSSNPVKSISKSYTSYTITDSSSAEVIAMGITDKNVEDYRYRAIENDSLEIMPWSKIPLKRKYGMLQACGSLGKYRSPGKQVMVEVQNIKDYSIRDGVFLDWRTNFKPAVTQVTIVLDANNPNASSFNVVNLKSNRHYATKFTRGVIPADLNFPADSVSYIRFDFKHHETVPYRVYIIRYNDDHKQVDNSQIAYNILADNFDVDSRYFKEAGSYEIDIQSTISGKEEDIIRIPFKVKPPPLGQKKVSLKQLIPYTIAALTGVAILFLLYRRQSRARLQRTQRDKEMVGLKLRSIRAQLNPHFMFNALTSIQNLINKNNISSANYYLSKFAGLTRQVLDSSNEEMLSLEDELQVLDDYLQMEQLRFNFKYTITADEQLDAANIEIPAMLLQPFVENAIKHGIATLGNEGEIKVTAAKQQSDLVLTVADNGVGFTPNGKAAGYGIKLSEDRVALLNQNYPGQNITLHIEAQQPGTRVVIRLNNWIA